MNMANNPRLARLIDLVPFITSHQGIAIEDLAQRFEISVEELKRDLELLWMCGLPDYTPLELMDFSFDDGFVSVRNADELKNPRSLTQNEIASLIIGLDLLENSDNESITALKNRLSEMVTSKVSYSPTPSDLNFTEIQQAIQNNQILEIRYSGKTRQVIPIELYKERDQIYLRSFCKLAKDRRTFKLSKIEELKITDSKELLPNSTPSNSQTNTVRIKAHRSERLIREILGDTKEVEYFSKKWLIGEIMALAGACEILDSDIRKELLSKAMAGKSLYVG